MRATLVVLLTVMLTMVGYGQNIKTNSQNMEEKNSMQTVYDFSLSDTKGNEVSLAKYKGKVLLIVNTATKCGFTPQYDELTAMYRSMRADGFEILDIPCNQFGNQAPGTDEEIVEFCRMNFGTEFTQFKKSDVNGENELPLYTWLKSQKGFEGFDKENNLSTRLESVFDAADPDWRSKSDIKWNFTKFLIDRNGHVVARFEPTKDMAKVAKLVREVLDAQ